MRKNREISGKVTAITTAVLILALLALDWAALQDIAKGEPNPYAEMAILLIGVGFAVTVVMTRKNRNAVMRSVQKASS